MKIKKHTTAGCYLIRENNNRKEICLIYKYWDDDKQGWMPPKGHVEKGETLEQAAIRETTEETGYKSIKILKPLETLNIEYPWDDGFIHKKSIHYFLAKLSDDKRIDLNLSIKEQKSTKQVKWFDLDNALEIMKFDDEREILKKLMRLEY